MGPIDRVRAFCKDTTDLSRGNVRVITEEPTEAQRQTWRMSTIPMSVSIAAYAVTQSVVVTLTMALAFSLAVGLAWKIATFSR